MNGRLVFKVTAAAAVLALTLPATASAPVTQYATFNRNDLTIADAQTSLRWQRGFATATSWDDAYAYCRGLSLGGIGPMQWRLPSVKELMTIVDEQITREYVNGGIQTFAIDRNAFPATPSAQFWAWPKLPPTDAWTVNFSDGQTRIESATTSSYYVRCVH